MSVVSPRKGKSLGAKNNSTITDDLKASWDQFIRGFSLAFACRSALSVLLRVLQLARSNKLREIFSVEKLIYRVEAVRLGLFVGQFSGVYELVTRLLARVRNKVDGKNAAVAGFLSGFSLLNLGAEDRRMVSLYALARVAQCVYNLLKARGLWHFWGSDWNHGDALLFAITSAQIMYAYVMRPTSLPESYYKFIRRTGPIVEEVLDAARTSNRGIHLDTTAVLDYVKKANPLGIVPELSPTPAIIGCDILHPMEPHCSKNFFRVLLSAFKKVLPVYGSLTIVSVVVVGFLRFIKEPLRGVLHGTKDTLRSTLFLSTLVALYQAVICTHRKLATTDHRFIYWFAGFFSAGVSILIEKKARRSELALYALPRALDSLYTILYDRKWLGTFPQGEVILFSLACSGIMYCYDFESRALSPMVKWVIGKILDQGRENNEELKQANKEKDKKEKEKKKHK